MQYSNSDRLDFHLFPYCLISLSLSTGRISPYRSIAVDDGNCSSDNAGRWKRLLYLHLNPKPQRENAFDSNLQLKKSVRSTNASWTAFWIPFDDSIIISKRSRITFTANRGVQCQRIVSVPQGGVHGWQKLRWHFFSSGISGIIPAGGVGKRTNSSLWWRFFENYCWEEIIALEMWYGSVRVKCLIDKVGDYWVSSFTSRRMVPHFWMDSIIGWYRREIVWSRKVWQLNIFLWEKLCLKKSKSRSLRPPYIVWIERFSSQPGLL